MVDERVWVVVVVEVVVVVVVVVVVAEETKGVEVWSDKRSSVSGSSCS